jgi:hypothetical protein
MPVTRQHVIVDLSQSSRPAKLVDVKTARPRRVAAGVCLRAADQHPMIQPKETDRHHFVSAGVWEAALLEIELLVQADRLVGGSEQTRIGYL